MAQLFRPSANTLANASIIGIGLLIGGGGALAYGLMWSSYYSGVGIPVDQTVPFSHEHHFKGLGIDCRYCHDSVEKSAFAGIPPTYTCMTCHSQIWKDNAQLLEPVRASLRDDTPLDWHRVHDVPRYAYFDHSIHVNKGVGCSTCHGRVDKMPLMWKENTLFMAWCLECHRNPEKNLRPQDQIFNMDWTPPANQAEVGKKLADDVYHLRKAEMTNCSTCHR